MRRAAMTVAALCICGAAGASHAEPIVGTTMTYGESVGGEAGERLAANLFVIGAVGDGWTVGGELSGSIEGYTGGYGCGTSGGDGVVPAVAVTCFQPGLAAHLLAGAQAAPSPASRLRVEVGVGATAVYLMPGMGGSTRRDTFASGLVRAAYLRELGTAFTGTWWAGVALEERAIGVTDTRLVRSIGLVLEAR